MTFKPFSEFFLRSAIRGLIHSDIYEVLFFQKRTAFTLAFGHRQTTIVQAFVNEPILLKSTEIASFREFKKFVVSSNWFCTMCIIFSENKKNDCLK